MNGTDGSVRESAIDWRAFRIVPSRFPPVDAWDRIAAPGDFAALAEIEGLTNPRIREALGVHAFRRLHRLRRFFRKRQIHGPELAAEEAGGGEGFLAGHT